MLIVPMFACDLSVIVSYLKLQLLEDLDNGGNSRTSLMNPKLMESLGYLSLFTYSLFSVLILFAYCDSFELTPSLTEHERRIKMNLVIRYTH